MEEIMSKPYFSMEGMAFKENGSDIEAEINIQCAMKIIHDYCFKGGSGQDAQEAMAFLEDNAAKVERFCDEIRVTFFLDDFQDSERKRAICTRAYNGLADRLNCKPV